MPPYLVDAAPTLDAGWLTNPDPDIYSSWEEFCKAAVLGLPGRRRSVRDRDGPLLDRLAGHGSMSCRPGWSRSTWTPGSAVTGSAASRSPDDILHLRYQSSVDDAHGHGPLEAGRATLVGAAVLGQYAQHDRVRRPIPPSILYSPEEMSPEQAASAAGRLGRGNGSRTPATRRPHRRLGWRRPS